MEWARRAFRRSSATCKTLEASVVQKERHLVDVEGFLSLRGRDLGMGLRW